MANSTTAIPMPGGPIQGPYAGTGPVVSDCIFIVVCTTVVALRFWAKRVTGSLWGWDDYILIPSLVLALAIFSVSIYVFTNCGAGYHEEAVLASDPSKLVLFAKLSYVATCFICLALTLPRCCILATYLRIFTNKLLRMITWIVLGLGILDVTLSFIINLTVCIPLEALWNPQIEGKCINQRAWWAFGTIPVVVFDIIVMALPVPTILQLHRPLHERLSLLFTFLAYGLATAAEIARIVVFNTLNNSGDATWAAAPLTYATSCEVGMYVIAACIPGLRSLWLYWRGQGPLTKRSSDFRVSKGPGRSERTPLRPYGSCPSHGFSGAKTTISSDAAWIRDSAKDPGLSQESFPTNEIKVVRGFEIA